MRARVASGRADAGTHAAAACVCGRPIQSTAAEAGLTLAADGYVANTVDANRLVAYVGQVAPTRQAKVCQVARAGRYSRRAHRRLTQARVGAHPGATATARGRTVCGVL